MVYGTVPYGERFSLDSSAITLGFDGVSTTSLFRTVERLHRNQLLTPWQTAALYEREEGKSDTHMHVEHRCPTIPKYSMVCAQPSSYQHIQHPQTKYTNVGNIRYLFLIYSQNISSYAYVHRLARKLVVLHSEYVFGFDTQVHFLDLL